MPTVVRLDRSLLFRLAALVWIASGLVRPLMYVTDAFGYTSALGASIGLSVVGAAIGAAVGAFLWLRPGRGSAFAAFAVGLYVVPTLAVIPLVGLPTWLMVLGGLGLLAFGLSLACLWATRRSRPAA